MTVYMRTAHWYVIGCLLQWSLLPLVENFSDDRHTYEVHVYTGAKAHAGTDSNVKFIVAGTKADSGIRKLDDGVRKNFQRGDVNPFLLQTSHDLGIPAYLRMWHDNSGKGNKAGWFLSKVVIVDQQTKQWYLFKCDKWLALDEDDGQTDRIMRVSSKEDIAADNELLTNNVAKAIWNDHIWLSVGFRQARSTFSRVQRLSCCLAILFLTMVSNAMFYGTGSDDTDKSAFTIGPLSVTIQQLYTSIASSIITVPPILIITTCFSKTRQQTDAPAPKGSGRRYHVTDDEQKASARGKRLPYWCLHVSWLLVFLCVAAGAFFSILYAMQWGRRKSEDWLLTFFMSFFESVFLLQPLKVHVHVHVHVGTCTCREHKILLKVRDTCKYM